MSNVWFNSDLHLSHAAVLTFENGFRSKSLGVTDIHEHDQLIYDLWNDTVKKRDTVFILGDLGFELDMIRKLPGNKKLILGNHDKNKATYYLNYFDDIIGSIKYKKHWLCHIPIHESELWGNSVIHGHTHSKGVSDSRYVNVCIEFTRGKPANFEDIRDGNFTTYSKVNKIFEEIDWDMK